MHECPDHPHPTVAVVDAINMNRPHWSTHIRRISTSAANRRNKALKSHCLVVAAVPPSSIATVPPSMLRLMRRPFQGFSLPSHKRTLRQALFVCTSWQMPCPLDSAQGRIGQPPLLTSLPAFDLLRGPIIHGSRPLVVTHCRVAAAAKPQNAAVPSLSTGACLGCPGLTVLPRHPEPLPWVPLRSL